MAKICGLNVVKSGNPGKKAIVFVHGFPFEQSMWKFQMGHFSEKYHCVSYDVRGMGKSENGDGQFTMETFANDFVEVINRLKLEKPIICGLSMGGYVCLRALEINQELFAGAILCDTKSEADDNAAKINRSNLINSITDDGMPQFVDTMIEKTFSVVNIEKLKKEIKVLKINSLATMAIGIKGASLAMLSRLDTTEVLSKIKIPVLLIVGEEDKLTPPELMQKMAEKIPKSEFHIVPNAAHMVPFENPEFVNAIVEKWLLKI